MHRFLCGVTLSAVAASTMSAQSVPTWHLQLDHAIRPTEGTEGELGDVSYLAVTRGGVVYVAERKSPRVTRYDATGKFAGVVMRSGEGPGEARDPQIALYGDTLVVYDQPLTRLTRISPTGKVIGSLHIDASFGGMPVWITRDGTTLLSYGSKRDGYNRNMLRISRAGHIDMLGWNERKGDHQFNTWMLPDGGGILGGPFSAAPSAAVDPTGHIVFGGSKESRWYVLSGKDTVQRVVLPDHPVTISRQVRDSAWNAFLAKFASNPAIAKALDKSQLPTVLPAWVSLDITPTGAWWIGRPGMDGRLASWDVVENGKLVGHVPLPQRIIPAGVYVRGFGSDLMALLHEDDNAVPWIGVYRIVRGK